MFILLTAQFPINCSEKGASAEPGNPSSWGKTAPFLQKGYSSIHPDCVGSYLNPELIVFNLLISYLLLFHFFTLTKSLTREERQTSATPQAGSAAQARSGCPPTQPANGKEDADLFSAPVGMMCLQLHPRRSPRSELATGHWRAHAGSSAAHWRFPRAPAQVKAPL